MNDINKSQALLTNIVWIISVIVLVGLYIKDSIIRISLINIL